MRTKEQLFKSASVKKCPVCYSTDGYYVKVQISGSGKQFVNFDGSLGNNKNLYKNLRHRKSKFAYCQSCDRRLFLLSDLK